MRKIGIITSGGDCSGMNGTIRAVVRRALAGGLEVVGIQRGYAGMIDGFDEDFQAMDTKATSGILQRGGTILHSTRAPQMKQEQGQQQALRQLRLRDIEGLVVIGGDGSLNGALALHHQGQPVIGIPASIDNDLPYTDMSLGVDTALNNITYAVDCIKDTASSHARAFVVETMGRNCGYLCLAAVLACGAEYALIPEDKPYDMDAISNQLRSRYEQGRDNAIIMVAEGVASAHEISQQIKDRIGFESRLMVLGHYQRGGSPSTFDRILGARFGAAAVEALMAGESGKMVGLTCGGLQLTDLQTVLTSGQRPIDQMMLRLSKTLEC